MELKQLINIPSLQAHASVAKTFRDAEGILLARNLTHVDPRVFNVLYPENVFLNSGLEIDNTGGYAPNIQKVRISGQGDFVDATERDTSKGLISVTGEEDTIKVIQREAHLAYTNMEVEQAKIANYSLVEKLYSAANRKYNSSIDDILADGGTVGTGLLNHAGFTAGAASGKANTLTGEQLYNEIAALIVDQWNGVNNTVGYMANKVIMPTSVYNEATTKTYLPNAGTGKVLKALKEAFPSVDFMQSWRGETVGAASATVAYSNARDAMLIRLPIPLTVGKTIPDGSFGYKADMFYRIGGIDVAENSAGRILTGL